MTRPGAPQITPRNLAIIVAKDLSPLRVNLRRRPNRLMDRGDDRHARPWLEVLILGSVPLGRIGCNGKCKKDRTVLFSNGLINNSQYLR
jgi:hypothetical protein